jgi:hypothetical protein
MTWTPERHAQAKARCEAAADGPWDVDSPFSDSPYVVAVTDPADALSNYAIVAKLQETNDANFIAHARTDLPDALAEIERLQKEINHVREFLPRVAELARLAFDDMEYPDSEDFATDFAAIHLASIWCDENKEGQ